MTLVEETRFYDADRDVKRYELAITKEDSSMAQRVTRYEYVFETETPEHCMEIAKTFHEVLRGNEDYIENRVILNVTGNRLTFSEFADSKTHFLVIAKEGEWPKLKAISGRYDWGTDIHEQ